MKEANKISKDKNFFFVLIMIFIPLLVADSCLYITLKYIGKNRNLFYEPLLPTDQQLDRFYEKHFHSKWGWDIAKNNKGALGNRISHDYGETDKYKIKIFGDSFTYGDGVENDETFQYIVEEKTDWKFLNYGVSAMATDQALLKFKDNNVHTKYTILGILDENIGRCMTVWWNFYTQNGFAGTKPRFTHVNGTFVLIDNPVKNYEDLQKLKDLDYINSLKNADYWQSYYEKLNAPPKLQWPATLTVASHFNFFNRYLWIWLNSKLFPSYENQIATRKYFHLYQEDSDGIKIVQHIVDEFIETAKRREEIPIVIIFAPRHSVDIFHDFNRKPHQPLIDHLEKHQYYFIDFADVFVGENYPAYYQGGNGHFSVKGNERIADKLIDYIKRYEQSENST